MAWRGGNELADALSGNSGDNRLSDSTGNDGLTGLGGYGSLEAGPGDDRLGAGANSFLFRGRGGPETCFLGSNPLPSLGPPPLPPGTSAEPATQTVSLYPATMPLAATIGMA